MNSEIIACADIETYNLYPDYGIALGCVIKPLRGKEEVYRIDKVGSPTLNSDDSALVKAVIERLNEFKILVMHNGYRFDRPFLNSRAKFWNQPMLMHPKGLMIDPCQVARMHFNVSSNSLDNLSEFFNTKHRKTRVDGRVWRAAGLDRNEAAMDKVMTHCVTPDARVLTADLRWVPAGDVKVGDKLVAFDENLVEGNGRKYRTAVVEAVSSQMSPVYATEMSTGQVLRTTPEHLWLVGHKGLGGLQWMRTDRLQVGRTNIGEVFPTYSSPSSYDEGWLAGLFNGEGSLSPQQHHHLTFGQRPGAVLDNALSILKSLTAHVAIRPTVSQQHTGLGKKDCMTVTVGGRMAERMGLIGKLRPVRLLQKVDPDRFGRLERRGDYHLITGLRQDGVQEIASIQTSTRTMIVEGYPMHNCVKDVLVLEEVFIHVLPFVTRITEWGSAR